MSIKGMHAAYRVWGVYIPDFASFGHEEVGVEDEGTAGRLAVEVVMGAYGSSSQEKKLHDH